ncbi:uncharacterized protein LOC114762570 [Neltuma alba]|uniref:uncharacterized protein LOC114762570 n=1 Tax=Neltuma alba TaxID=207710 RepID=UPI0010A3E64B|nr:uncharacterized protein LOC114762570 [Prosopis alba]
MLPTDIGTDLYLVNCQLLEEFQTLVEVETSQVEEKWSLAGIVMEFEAAINSFQRQDKYQLIDMFTCQWMKPEDIDWYPLSTPLSSTTLNLTVFSLSVILPSSSSSLRLYPSRGSFFPPLCKTSLNPIAFSWFYVVAEEQTDHRLILDMLDILFGWSKASKCKKVIKRARCRLKLLKNKRQAIARQSREDAAELIKCGHQESAVNRVEQLIKDETLSGAYELLDHFCEFILTQLSYIRRHKDCPNDINEAVSSLIFASARIGDLPELFVIRKLFGQRYGQRFATTAVELVPGNLVNKQLIESLSLKSVPYDVKYRVVDEIARDHCLQPEVLAIEYYPDWQQMQEREIKEYEVEEDGGKPEMHVSEVEEIQREIICVDSPIKKLLLKPTSPRFLRESNAVDVSAIISTVRKYLPYIQSFPLQKMAKVQNISKLLPGLKDTRELVAYDNDIEEPQSSASRNGSFRDQRLMKFREQTRSDYGHQSNLDERESESDKSSTRSSRKSKRAREKRIRRRSASLESQCIMDIGCLIYYHHKPSRNASSHRTCSRYHLKHQKPFIEALPQPGYAHKRLKQHNSSEMEQNACSLDNPCYCSVHDDSRDCLEGLQVNPNIGIRTIQSEEKPISNEESNKGMELVSVPQRAVYNVFTYPDCNKTEKQKNGTPEAYARAVTMPPERHKTRRDKMMRMYSCPPEYPNHVHPKLPDYDDLAAKFNALKREHLQNKVTSLAT